MGTGVVAVVLTVAAVTADTVVARLSWYLPPLAEPVLDCEESVRHT